MRAWLRLIAVLTVGLAATAALAAAGASAAAGLPAGCRSIALTAAANGRSLVLRPCDRVTISLAESDDGGYRWIVTRPPARQVLRLVSSRAVPTPVPVGTVGGPVTRVIVYTVTAAGTTSLALEQERSQAAGGDLTFAVSIRVR